MKKVPQNIKFHYLVSPFAFPNRNALKDFLLKQLKKEGKTIEAINYIFCDDAYLLQINQQHLNHDTFTDIITFEFSPKGQPLVSDIYVSVERVKENAATYKARFSEELLRVIFHGALHLSGYKDKSKEQSHQMRLKENEWLKRYTVSRGTQKKSKD